jgi:outer membrane protein
VNYNIILSEGNAAGFTGLDIDNGWGFSLQAGIDVALRENWYFNLDVKKTWMNVDATTNLGANTIAADIDVDPWIVGVGIGYRF